MTNFDPIIGCGTASHFNRRTLLKAAGLSGVAWLTPVAQSLARAAEKEASGAKPKSVIVLYLQGGPSQIETFDPHPGDRIAAGSRARNTAVKGIQINENYEQLADQMQDIALVRSVMSKEGDHERATYNMKTGFRPDPTLVHPSLGAIMVHQLGKDDKVEIPNHVSIIPSAFPARGGHLGDKFDAFKIGDPNQKIPDVTARVDQKRFDRRIERLRSVVEKSFTKGRLRKLDDRKTLQDFTTRAAIEMMSSEQLKAFDVKEEPQGVRDQFGDTAFGRGCLTAVRLIGVGVRCVEVTLSGWDSHANNHEVHKARAETLDPAFAALIRELKRRELFESTIVLCGGEFGRTPGRPGNPGLNLNSGRDHWPHGFSVALAGGAIRGGQVIGETSPDPTFDEDRTKDVVRPVNVQNIHATILHALGIDFARELPTPVGRPMAMSKGEVIEDLLV